MIFTITFQISSIIRIGSSLCKMCCSMCRARPEPYAIHLIRGKEPIGLISSHSNSSNHNSNSSNSNHDQIQSIYLSNHPQVQ